MVRIEGAPREPESTTDPPLVECPRCAYDLRGEVSRWRESCPLAGRCNECGVEIEWGRLYAEQAHPWLFEYAWKRRFFASYFGTLIRLFIPWRFWRAVDMSLSVRLRALAAFLTLTVFIPVFVGLVMAIWSAWSGRNWYRGSGESEFEIVVRLLRWWLPHRFGEATGPWHQPLILPWVVLIPMLFVVLPDSLRRAKVRPGHILRIAAYTAVFLWVPAAGLWICFEDPVREWSIVDPLLAPLDRLVYSYYLRPVMGAGVSYADSELIRQCTASLLVGVFTLGVAWRTAMIRYLRLERPTPILVGLGLIVAFSLPLSIPATSTLAILILIAIAVGYFIPNQDRRRA